MPQQQLHLLGRRLVGPAALAIVLRERYRETSTGRAQSRVAKGKRNQDGEDHPLVPPVPGGIAVTGADGVPVAGLAVNFPAGVFGDGVIADQANTSLGPEVLENEAGEDRRQGQAGPLGQGENAVVTGGVAFGQISDRAQQVGQGASAMSEEGGDAQQLVAYEGSGVKGRAKKGKQRHFLICYTTHTDLRMGDAWTGWLPP